MKCVRCSAEIPSQSQFCLRCGTPVAAGSPTGGINNNPSAPLRPAMSPPKNSNTPLIATVAVLAVAVLALGAFMVRGMLAQKPESDAPTGLVQAPRKQQPTGLVEKPAETKPVEVVQKPVEAPQGPPAEIVNYLAFLKGIEERRKTLESDEIAHAMALQAVLPADQAKQFMNFGDDSNASAPASNPAPVNETLQSTKDFDTKWNQIAKDFQSKSPPQSCQAIHDNYTDFLGKSQTAILNVFNVLEGAKTNPQKALEDAQRMKGSSKPIDDSMHRSDAAVKQVCDQYNIPKDFDISESGGGNMFGF